jgi:hypothetical protein
MPLLSSSPGSSRIPVFAARASGDGVPVDEAATAVSVTVLVPAGLREELRVRARRNDRSFSAELRRAAEAYLVIDETTASALLAGKER